MCRRHAPEPAFAPGSLEVAGGEFSYGTACSGSSVVTAVVQLRPLASELPAKRVAPQKSGTWVFDRYLFIFFCLCRAAPKAYGSFWARG